MIALLGRATSRFARRWIPDPFVFAILLTGVAFAATGATSHGPLAGRFSSALGAWYRGLWESDGLAFALQMCLVLVTGHALAISSPARRALRACASRVRTPSGAAAATAAVSIALAYLHWGLGLVGGGVFAREVRAAAARRRIAIDVPLVVASAYLSLLVWHGGLSGSAPLLVATPGHFLEDRVGVVPLSQTIFSPANLLLCGGLLVALPILVGRIARGSAGEVPAEESPEPAAPVSGAEPGESAGFARTLDRSRVLAGLFALLALGALVARVRDAGLSLDLNSLNLLFLVAGLVAHGNARSYAGAVTQGAGGVGGIVLQFPLYFGIRGLLREGILLEESAQACAGLAQEAARMGVPVSVGFPLLVFLLSAGVNLFIPSGGGQWVVQGPVVVEAARALGVPFPKVLLAFAYGDEWTNMAQPFWALALVGLTGVPAPRILGYSVALMLLSTPLFVLAIALAR
jgi:short-chain fatty acids transporter